MSPSHESLMNSQDSDRRHLERQILFARPIIIVLSILATLEWPSSAIARRCLVFLFGYLVLSLAIIGLEILLTERDWHSPLLIDLIMLVVLIYLVPFTVPVWFPFLFVSYAAGCRWGMSTSTPLTAALALIITLVDVVDRDTRPLHLPTWVAIVGAMFASGAGLAFLGDRNRRWAEQNHFLST